MSSLPGNGCHCVHVIPWPYPDSAWSVLLFLPLRLSLGLSLGCGSPLCDLAWTAYMGSGPRTKLLAFCSKQGQAWLSPDQNPQKPLWLQFLSVLLSSPQAPSGLRSGPGSIGLNFCLLPLWWLPLWTGLLSTGQCILKAGHWSSDRPDPRSLGQIR